jgi:glycosyltransferase involved in cell wall biosynthesis
MVRRLKAELKVPVVCMLQGEDSFLDSLPEHIRGIVWQTLAERCAEVDHFIAPTRYFGELMSRRLSLRPERWTVVYNGINLEGYHTSANPAGEDRPVLGYFARMCREKGLHTLVDAFILLKNRPTLYDLRLKVGGACGQSDEGFVDDLREKLSASGLLDSVEFHPNLTRDQKLEFFHGLTAFSVPALYGEAFGLYVIEALAAGVPVVQPRTAAFPELLEATGGGVLAEAGSPNGLANALEGLLLTPERARLLGERGRAVVLKEFSAEAMTRNMVRVFERVAGARAVPA